jgi:YD repeat-containing protein
VGRITQQVLPGARQISYLYDANGNLTSLTPPGKPAHSFGYTAVDLTERYTPPLLNGDSTVTRYLHGLDQRLRNTIRPDSIVISVIYDTVGCASCAATARLKTIIFDRGTLNFAYNSTTGLLNSLYRNYRKLVVFFAIINQWSMY